MRIETERLVLDALTATDAPALAAIAGNPAVAPMLLIFPSPCPVEFAAGVIARSQDCSRPGFRLAVREGGALAGSVGISPTDGAGASSVMYFLDPARWGRGLMGEAMRAFVDACLARFDLAALTASRYEDNPASGAILTRLGFKEIGRGMGASAARQAPAPEILYRLEAP